MEHETEFDRLHDAAVICAEKLCEMAELLVDAANALMAVIPVRESGE